MTKLKIDLSAGTLEVEGEESFVREIYKDYKDKISNEPIPIPKKIRETQNSQEVFSKKTTIKNSGGKTSGKRKESYQIIKDLDLSSKGGKESLRDFCSKKSPRNAMEKSAVFVYYLQKIAGIKGIGPDHIYTCYKDVNEKVPGALRQSLLDTSSRKGWIDTKSMEDITIATHGENLVEHELPKKSKEK